MTVRLSGGAVSLEDWRAIYAGAGVALDPATVQRVEAGAAAVQRIIARGEPVYGVNTGFGKLASVRIADADLVQLQRNIVLSHAAGVGEPASVAATRLMMALKLDSLAQGASGVRPATLALIEAMLERGVTPVVPAQGSVGASGDLAPLAHMTAAMIGVGEARFGAEVLPASVALERAGLAPRELGPKEGLALLNGTQFSTAHALAGLFEVERVFRAALVTGALSTDAARGSDAPFDPRIVALRRHRGPARGRGDPRRADGRQRDPRVPPPGRSACAGPLLPALPAAGDGRLLRSSAPGGGDARRRGQRRHRQSADFPGGRRSAVGRQFPRRAGRLRRRHDRAGRMRDRLARRATDRHAGRSGACRACRRS